MQVLSFSYDGLWGNSSTPTCYEQMVPMTATKLGRGFLIGKERVVSKVSGNYTASASLFQVALRPSAKAVQANSPSTTTSSATHTVYIYEQGYLVKQYGVVGNTVELLLTDSPPVEQQQLGIIVWGTEHEVQR